MVCLVDLNTKTKRYGDIEYKQGKLVRAEFLTKICSNGEVIYGQEFNKSLRWTFDGYADFWVLDDDGETCRFKPANPMSFYMAYCEPA